MAKIVIELQHEALKSDFDIMNLRSGLKMN